jgi:excinuclease ABC subunit A
LAFDTIYAEGQRRYVESLSAYARQFLGLMEKPDVDFIDGLSPAISIEQRSSAKNPRSTVGTVTEIYDYLRLLFARIGVPFCFRCGKPIQRQTVSQMVDHLLELKAGTRFVILSPIIEGRKGEHREALDQLRKKGLVRVRVDGAIYDFDDVPALNKKTKHTVEAVVDRLVAGKSIKSRLADSLETALRLAGGSARVSIEGDQDHVFSETAACPDCGLSFEEPSPRLFSFNSPYGACETCGGLGNKMEIDPELVVPNPTLSIFEGAIHPWGEDPANWYRFLLRGVAAHFDFNFRTRFCDLSKEAQRVILTGSGRKEFTYRYEHRDGRGKGEFTGKFEGVIPNLERRYRQTESNHVRQWIEQYMRIIPCPACQGARLKPEALAVRVHGKSINEVVGWSIKRAAQFFAELKLSTRERQIARQIMKELGQRLGFLVDVGLDYLTLDRSAQTLSGGEAQRIRLATQIGSRLVGVLYILDEPSIGLHQRDNRRLLNTLFGLRDLGNSVLVVEHDRETIESADYVIDLGPGAGKEGGAIVATGTPAQIRRSPASLTGQYLAYKKEIPNPAKRRKGNGNQLRLGGAVGNNLKKVTIDFPLGVLTCVTGVSGSGKSTLVNETLYRILAEKFFGAKTSPLPYERITGIGQIDKVIDIDQSPIGRTPRSNPATYTGLFTFIRDLFAQLPESKMHGYGPGRFSFNVKGGRCEACQGDGIIKIEMHFLPDVYVPCEVCKGKRYNRETLEIQFKGKTITDVLDMTVTEALGFFANFPRIKNKLLTLANVGLGYIHLGQQATTLSGGEAQRVKLSTELSKVATGRTFYILDEPTTGLHFEDIKMLLRVLNELVDRGNTVVVIEHNLDVIKTADWIIDLGPEGGDEGGMVIAVGTPEEVAKVSQSYTGQFLKTELSKNSRPKKKPAPRQAVTAG